MKVCFVILASVAACAPHAAAGPPEAEPPPGNSAEAIGSALAHAEAPAPPPDKHHDEADCIDATSEGTIGNCIEPALVIVDRCASRRYSLQFDACYEMMSGAVDVSKLSAGSSKLMLIRGAELRGSTEVPIEIVAVRGNVGPGLSNLSDVPFDIEVDCVIAGTRQTHPLRGVARRSP
jgi:hypothetical protein